MATNDSELVSIDEAFELADAELEVSADDEALEELTDEAPEVEESVEGEEAEVDADEQPEDENAEEETAPAKLSDLVAEEPEAEPDEGERKALTYDDDMVVEVPDVGPKTLKELREGFLRQGDYTKKTQDLAEQRKALEKAETLWSMLEEDTVGTIAQMALQAGLLDESQVANLPKVSAKNPILAPEKESEKEDIDALVAKKVQEVIENTPEFSRMRQEARTQQVKAELDQLEKDYGTTLDNDDRLAIVKTAIANQQGIEFTYLKMQKQLEKAIAEHDRIASAATKQRSGKLPKRELTDEKPASLEEAWEWAVSSFS
jgi:hypothetical protein